MNSQPTQTEKGREIDISTALNKNVCRQEIMIEKVTVQETILEENSQYTKQSVSVVLETPEINEGKPNHPDEDKLSAFTHPSKLERDHIEESKREAPQEKFKNIEQKLIEDTTKDDEINTVAHRLSEKLQLSPEQTDKEEKKDIDPRIAVAVNAISACSHIVVLTGAGLSVASNIPTFRGEGGFWTLRNQQNKLKASKFLTHRYFKEDPEEIWRWHHVFKKLASQNSPNISHHAIADFQVFCKQTNRKFTLVTQNVDSYHIEAYIKAATKSNLISLTSDQLKVPEQFMKNKFGICDDIYEIHGSAEYMRCDEDCTLDLFPSPEVGCADDFVDRCPKCQGIARPHTLFFDERYNEHYYRRDTLMEELKTMDCLIVIGTALETNLASTIVEQAVNENNLVVEINPKPLLEEDNVINLVGGAEKFVPDMFEGLKKNLLENRKTYENSQFF